MVQEKSYTERRKNLTKVWQTGVLLEKGGNRAVKQVRCKIMRTKKEASDLT